MLTYRGNSGLSGGCVRARRALDYQKRWFPGPGSEHGGYRLDRITDSAYGYGARAPPRDFVAPRKPLSGPKDHSRSKFPMGHISGAQMASVILWG